jgi:hypothetical protein
MSIAQAFIGINLAVNVILVFWVIKPQMGCLLSSVVLGFVLLFGGGLLMGLGDRRLVENTELLFAAATVQVGVTVGLLIFGWAVGKVRFAGPGKELSQNPDIVQRQIERSESINRGEEPRR